MAAPLMQMGVLVTPYINQQGFNAMAKSQGANFAAQFQNGMARAAQPLGRITGQVSEFEKSMAAANARVLAFGASAGSIYLVKDAFEKMITSTIEVEKSLANINVILSLGQGALKSFSSEMFKAASQTGQTFQTASAVALEFARHGVSATETAKRMTSAMQLMRISGLDAQDSVNAITAAINAFNKEGLSSIDIVNRLTAVDTKFAVSAQDLAKAVERVGSTATEAGIKFNQLLGLVTAVQTATARGGAVIGNAFKSIFTRLARPEVLSDLEAIGVTTRTASGQILPMVDLLKRLASQYNTLNYAQKSFVTEAVGGVYQVNILKASLADLGRGFSIYDKAAITASQSTGLIEQRMASLNDTISSKLNTTTLQFTRLVSSFGNTAFGAGAKGGLDSFNKQIETIGDGLDDVAENSGFGEKIGHSMAQGVAKGLGDIVSGPGIQIAMALVTKIAKGLGSFAYQSSREFMGLNEPAKQQAAVQQSINGFLQQNVSLVNQWARGQLSLNTLVGVYLQSMKNASIYQGQMANMVGGATPIISPSVHVSHATPHSGFIPSFGIPNAQREIMGALAGGYKPGRIFQERIEGLGYVTMNGAETVKRFDGMSQKAILPPRNSKAGANYQKAFEGTHGFDPYASDGYVPNFALYHRDVYVPPVTQQAIQKFVSTPLSLSYGSHAKKAVSDDIHKFGPSGIIPIPKSLKLGHSDIFEVETGQTQSDIQKVVVRRKGDKGLDQILALMPDGNGSAFIKTVWHNQSSDVHKTLDKTKYATAAAGHIPNFGLMNMLGGLGGIGGNLLQKQNLPADISDAEMEKLFAQYATAMYNPKAGKTPVGINLFANKAFHSSFVEKEGNYVFGQHDNNVFLPTHFAPKSKMGGLSIMKDLKKYDNVVMAITKDLSPLLQKAGFAALKENVPVSFRGGEAMKDILVSNKLRTPILGAGMFAALAGGNAKDYFMQHGMRNDKSQRQFYYGEEGRMHNVETYMRDRGMIAAGGIVPKKGYGPMMPDKLQELAYLHKAIKEKRDKKESTGNMMSVFNNKMYEAGFAYGTYADNFVQSLTPVSAVHAGKFHSTSEDKVFPGFNMAKLNANGISKDDLRRLLGRQGKIRSGQHNYPEFYDIDEFQTMFQEKKKFLGVKRSLESKVGFGIKPEYDSYIKQLLNKDTSVGDREYYAKNLQSHLIGQAMYGDKVGSWNLPPLKSVFQKGKIGKINDAMTEIFDLSSEKNKVYGKPISRSLLSERKYLRKQLYIGSYPDLANNSVTPERRAELMEDEIFTKAQRRRSIVRLLGQNKIMEKLKGLIPGFSHDLPSKADIISGNNDYVPGSDLLGSAKYVIPRSDQRENFASLRNFIDEIRGYGADPESGGDDKQLLKNMPTILNTLLPNGPAFDTRQIYRAYSKGLSIHGQRGQLFKKGGEYQSNSAKIWDTRKRVMGKVKSMTKELFKPSVEVPAKWKDNYNSNITPIMSFNIAKRNLGANVFRGVNAIEKLYGESIDNSDLVFRGAGAQEFALMDKLGAFTSVGRRTDEKRAGAYVTSSLMKASGYAISSQFDGRPGAVGIYSKAGLTALGAPQRSAAGNESYNSLRFPKLAKSALMGVFDLERGRILKLQQYLAQFGNKFNFDKEFLEFNQKMNSMDVSSTLSMMTPEKMPSFSGSGMLDLFRQIHTKGLTPNQPNFRGPSRPISDDAKKMLMESDSTGIMNYIRNSLSSTQPGVMPFGSDATSFFDLRNYRPISRNFRKGVESGRLSIKDFGSVVYHKQVPLEELMTPERLDSFVGMSPEKKLKQFHKGLTFDLGSFRAKQLIGDSYINEREYPVLTFGGQANQKFDVGKLLAVSTGGNAGLKFKPKYKPSIDDDFSHGFVPNFRNPLAEAFQRENSPTATLGYSPRVKSAQNPLGAMVYDRAYQKSPEDAFRQHAAIGQTDVKNMGKADGFVPNFGIADSLALGALQGTFNNINGVLSPLSYHYNKQLELVRRMNEEYASLTSQIRAGGEIKYNGNSYANKTAAGGVDIRQNLRDFLLDFRQANASFVHSPLGQSKQNTAYDAYRGQVQRTQQKLGTFATYGMVGAPLALETGASFAKNFGKLDLSKGLETFSSGMTMAGQLLSTFPNKLGVLLSSSAIIKSLSDSISIAASGFGKFERSYDLASTKAEKMASSGNAVIETFERLRTASTDATVTLDEYQALQEKYARSLADLASIQANESGKGGGAEVVRKLAGAGTAEAKQKIVAQAIDAQNQQKGELGIRMQLAQLTAQSSVFGMNYGKSRKSGIFSATSDIDALEKQTLLASTAVQIEQGALSSNNLPKGFADRMKKAALTDEDVSAMTREASKSPILEGLDENSVAQVMRQFVYEINKFKMPPGVQADEWSQHLESLNDLTAKEFSLRLKYNQELQNVLQKGSILSDFSLTTGAGKIESKYRMNTMATFTQGKSNELASLTTSEGSMIGRRGKTKSQEIQDQISRDLALNQNRGAREINSSITGAAKDAITGGLQATGNTTQNVLALSEARLKANDFVAKRQQLFSENPSALINLAKNPEKFGESFLGDKGEAQKNGITSAMYDTIANKLSTAVNSQQSTITSILEETKQINEKGLADLAQLSLEQTAAIKEARFQELAQGIKGIDELARGGARKARRELRRDEYIVNHSRSAIRRGEAARDMLNYIPSDQRDYNDPQIRRLYNTAQSGSKAAYNYIFRGSSLSRFGQSDERSFARTFGNYKGVNTPTLGFSESEKSARDAGLSLAVNAANHDLESFGGKLNDIGLSLENFKKALQEVVDARTKEGGKYGEVNSNPASASPNVNRVSPVMDNLKQYGASIISGAIQGAFILLALRRGGALAGAGNAAKAGGLASSVATKLAAFINPTKASGVTSAIAGGVSAASKVTGSAAKAAESVFSPMEQAAHAKYLAGKAATTTAQVAATVTKAAQAALPKTTAAAVTRAGFVGSTTGAFGRGFRDESFIGRGMAGQSTGNVQSLAFRFGRNLGAAGEQFTDARSALNRGFNGGSFIGKEMAGQSAGTFQRFAFGVGRRIGSIGLPSGITDAGQALARGVRGGPFIGAEMAGQAAGGLQSAAYRLGGGLGQLGRMANPLSGWTNAGVLGKTLRVGGVLGAGLAVKGAYDQARQGNYSGAAVGLGSTALSFAGPVGLAGSIGVSYTQRKTDEYMGYRKQIGDETGRGMDLDNKLAFMKKYGGQYKAAVNKGIDATDDDKKLMANYERATGSNAIKTKTGVIQRQATDFFNSKKDMIAKNLIHPVGTFEDKGNIYGYTGRGSRTIIGKSSDANKAEEIKAYTAKEEARRNAEIQNLSRSKQGLAYLDAQNQRASKFAEDLTVKKFLPEQAAAEKANTPAEQPKPQPQEVKISAEPATVIVKLAGNDGQILQTILTKLAFLETSVNSLQGTPKPASVNQVVSQ